MALFKIFNNIDIENGKTERNNLPDESHKGYCYFDANTNLFYIDIKDSNGKLLNIYDTEYRVALNGYMAACDGNNENIYNNIQYIKNNYVLNNILVSTLQEHFNSTKSTDARIYGATLYADQWIGREYKIYINNINDDIDFLVSPSNNCAFNYIKNNVQCEEHSLNTLTFTCDTTPEEDIGIEILLIGELTESSTDITYANIFNTNNYEFTGKAIEPNFIIKMGETILTKNVDYTILYVNNINIGIAHAEISGIGNYSGSKIIYFMIYPKHYITFFNEEGLSLTAENGPLWDGEIYYSTDKLNWSLWDGTTIESHKTEALYLRGVRNSVISCDENNNSIYSSWKLEGGNISIFGDINNLLDYKVLANGGEPFMGQNCFKNMFSNNQDILYADKLILPKKVISQSGCQEMFSNCINLQTPPIMPATHIEDYGYKLIFFNCLSLYTVPQLPGQYLGQGAYDQMFSQCQNLLISDFDDSYPYTWSIPSTGITYGPGGSGSMTFMLTPEIIDGQTYWNSAYISFNGSPCYLKKQPIWY